MNDSEEWAVSANLLTYKIWRPYRVTVISGMWNIALEIWKTDRET